MHTLMIYRNEFDGVTVTLSSKEEREGPYAVSTEFEDAAIGLPEDEFHGNYHRLDVAVEEFLCLVGSEVETIMGELFIETEVT